MMKSGEPEKRTGSRVGAELDGTRETIEKRLRTERNGVSATATAAATAFKKMMIMMENR